MLDQILHWDLLVFRLINGSELTFLDYLTPYFRHKLFWLPLYTFLVAFILSNYKHRMAILLFLIGTVAIADYTSSQLIKKSVKRVRPCNDPMVMDSVTLRIRCGGGYSFTSSHATNHAAVAFYLFYILHVFSKGWRILLPVWAALICLAQVYVGVHYPIDILSGFLLGSLIGIGVFKVLQKWIPTALDCQTIE